MGRRNHYRDRSFSRGSYSLEAETRRAVRALQEMGAHVVEAGKRALGDGAKAVAKDARERCPVYEGHKKKDGRVYFAEGVRPGALRDSVKAEPNKDGTIYRISADARDASGFLYGQVVEFSPKVNRPFLYPAMDANRDAVRRAVAEAVRDAVKGGHGNGGT